MTINHEQQPTLPGLDDTMIICSVAQGTATQLVAIWRLAHKAAAALSNELMAAGLDAAEVVASVDDAGRPTVHVLHLQARAAHRLTGELAGSGGGGPPAPT